QGLQGAETVLLALRNAIAAAPVCGFDAPRVLAWETRAMELEQAIRDNFFVATAPAHFEGGRPAWLLGPVGFFLPGDPAALSHAEFLKAPASGYRAPWITTEPPASA